MKEIYEVDKNSYQLFKKTIMEKSAVNPTQESIEKQRDEKFKSLFKELWPNVYDRIDKSEKSDKSKDESAKFLTELEKNRAMVDLMVKEDLEKYKFLLAAGKNLNTNHMTHCHCANCLSPNSKDSINIRIDGLNTGKPNFSILPPKPEPEKKPEPPKPNYPNLLSSYDFPYYTAKHKDQLVKSSYNPSDLTNGVKLLQSIKESQEKLKMTQKVEKTTDLVDDIINKVKVLQDDMKKQSTMIKVEKEIEEFKKGITKIIEKIKF